MTRTRSAQKLPIRPSCPDRASPRASAAATAMPTAADTKFCTARPAIWKRWPAVASPEYHCQLVLVTKETAVFHAPSLGQGGMPIVERQVVLEASEPEQEQDATPARSPSTESR